MFFNKNLTQKFLQTRKFSKLEDVMLFQLYNEQKWTDLKSKTDTELLPKLPKHDWDT